MKPIAHRPMAVAWPACLLICAGLIVGCTDVGDDLGASGSDASSNGFDATALGSQAAEGGSNGLMADGAEPSDAESAEGADGAPMTTNTPASDDSSTSSATDSASGTEMETGTGAMGSEASGVDSGTSGVDSETSGVDSGTSGVDSGTNGVDSGNAVDSGVAMDSGANGGMDSGVDSGSTSGADSGGSSCAAICPKIDMTYCPIGLTTGIGYDATTMAGCNATEALLATHSPTCLECALNAPCLHDNQGDNPTAATPTFDCEDAVGNESVDAGSTRTRACLTLLACDLASGCAKTNGALDCYCGLNVGSSICLTMQTGACIPEVQFGLENTSPSFIESNITATAGGTGGAIAGAIMECLHNNCLPECF